MDTIIVTCPHCAAANRVPTTRLTSNPQCGRCHQSLFVAAPMTVDDASFESLVMRSQLPVLVDFWAPWCGPCLHFAPTFKAAARSLEPGIRLAKLDTEANPQTSARFAIRSIPTLIVFQAGKELARQSGAMSMPELLRWGSSFAV